MSNEWLIAVIGFVGVLVGAIVTGVLSIWGSRISRRADFQRQTLLEIQDQLVTFKDAIDDMLWNMPEGYDSKTFSIPPPPPTIPDEPYESFNSFKTRMFYAAMTRQSNSLNQLQRLGPRVANAEVRAKLSQLLNNNWIEKNNFDKYNTSFELFVRNGELNDLIGKVLRES